MTSLPMLKTSGAAERRQGRNPDDRNFEREPERACRGNSDPDPGERSRSHGDRDAIQRRQPSLGPRRQPLDQRHQRLGVAALHQNALDGERLRRRLIEDSGGERAQRRVDGENSHRDSLDESERAINRGDRSR